MSERCRRCGLAPVVLDLTVSARLSHTGRARRKRVGVDACIAPLVAALNARGVLTDNSCCGHGDGPRSIVLHDGSEAPQ